MQKYTIDQLKNLRESEDHIEFKQAEYGNFAYNGGTRSIPKERRKCILGYVTALCNEGGGDFILGMHDKYPHKVTGTSQYIDAIGALESKIYNDTGIRPVIYELFEDEQNKKGRVVVIHVEGRPVGKLFRFEDVPLMRVGEDLKPMSDEMIYSILQEHEPDFSAEICKGLKFSDLDPDAIKNLKDRYAEKQKNPSFKTLTDRQALSDLHLITGSKITYAALILVGKAEVIHKILPQAAVFLEYRKSEALIPYDNRQYYCAPFYKMVDMLWHDINLRNSKIDVYNNSYIDNIFYFNESVIREAINNAIAHRDYRRSSEIVIKLYPELFVVMNAGGFPLGVTIDNILKVQSTPRNRLLSDVLAATGVVERSGQGVDKIFRVTISEGKEKPDYSHSDAFRVELRISSSIQDKAFALFLESEQRDLKEEDKLSVDEVITLANISKGNLQDFPKEIIEKLLRRGLIEKRGKTRAIHYIMAKSYFEFKDDNATYSLYSEWGEQEALPVILQYFSSFQTAKMKDFAKILEPHMTRRQVRSLIERLYSKGILDKDGKGPGTKYFISQDFINGSSIVVQALGIGLEELKKRGILGSNGQEMSKKSPENH